VTLVNHTGQTVWPGSTVNADGSVNFTSLPTLADGQSATHPSTSSAKEPSPSSAVSARRPAWTGVVGSKTVLDSRRGVRNGSVVTGRRHQGQAGHDAGEHQDQP
jgi:hypothetical protein